MQRGAFRAGLPERTAQPALLQRVAGGGGRVTPAVVRQTGRPGNYGSGLLERDRVRTRLQHHLGKQRCVLIWINDTRGGAGTIPEYFCNRFHQGVTMPETALYAMGGGGRAGRRYGNARRTMPGQRA